MKNIIRTFLLATIVCLWGCQEENFDLGPIPGVEEAEFSVAEDTQGANYIVFTNSSVGFLKKWDFGNGSSAEGDVVTAYYPFKGDYTVTVTVFTKGGSVTSTQQVSIATTDPEICNVEILQLLTGGCDALEGKTWVIDADRSGHFGLGPGTAGVGGPTFTPDWYKAGANEKTGGGLYNDEYTFFLNESRFVQETNGDVYLNGGQAGNFPGSEESPVGDYIAPFTAAEIINYSLSESDGNQFISFNNNGFIGYATGVNTYQILSITEDEMFIRFRDEVNTDFAWYHRLIRKGYVPPPPPGPSTTKFPVDFETEVAPFNGFGGSTYEVIENPDASGANTSAKVGQYIKGFDGNWAGIETKLDAKLDFSTNTLIEYKVWSPVAGRALFKLESQDGSATPMEVFVDVTTTNQWEVLTFDFSGAASDTYDKIAMFLDFDNNNGGTFYFDDIRQTAPPLASVSIDFEASDPGFAPFGGNVYNYVDNPDASGINVSGKVGESVHGHESWAGMSTDLAGPIDFSSSSTFKMKVRGPVTGVIKFKIESTADSNVNIEVDVNSTKTDEWEELSFDFSGAASGTYDRIVVFFNFGTTDNTEVFHFDDIVLQ